NRSDGHRQSRESLKKERVRKQHQVNQLRNPRFPPRKLKIHHQAQITHHQQNRYRRRHHKCRMDRNVIAQIRQQQVEREKRARQEKIVHWMNVDAAQRRQYENQEEEKEERHRRKIRNPSRQRTRLQLLWHLQRDVEPAYQVLVIPLQLPA